MSVSHEPTAEAETTEIIDSEVSLEFLNRIPGGIFKYHATGNFELDYVNMGLVHIFGCDTVEEFKELVGNTFKGMVHPDDFDIIEREIYEQTESTGSAHVKYRIFRKDGEVRYINDYTRYAMDSDGKTWFYATILDSTEEMLSHQNNLDQLTKVMNRSGAMVKIDEMLSKGHGPCTLIFIDLDDFKYINDCWGHPEGDRVLKRLAEHITKIIHREGIIARWGGDEFIVFAQGLDEGATLNRLIAGLVDTPFIELRKRDSNEIYFPTISVGTVSSPDSDVTLGELYKQADRALYRGKSFGKACACLTSINEADSDDAQMHIIRGFTNQGFKSSWNLKRHNVLIVDDSAMNRELLKDILEDDYNIIEASCGEEAIRLLEVIGTDISIVLLDIMMPGIDGFEVMEIMKARDWISDIPVVTISADSSISYMQRAYELGATDYIGRPFDANIVRKRVANTIMLYAKQQKLIDLVTEQIYDRETNNTLMILILSHIVEFRNGESGLHVLNISTITDILLREMKFRGLLDDLDQSDISRIVTASALHDIGKIAIDEDILNKPGKLTDSEFAKMKEHTVVGDEILLHLPFQSDAPLVKTAREICRWHHERYDGNGYPDGLVGNEIPISAQVVALADVYDALTSQRAYKSAYTHEEAVDMIMNGECGQFNPLLLECFYLVADSIKEQLSEDYESSFKERELRNALDEITNKLLDADLSSFRIMSALEQISEDLNK